MTNHTTYTADDFATARFAARPDGRLAMRDLNLEYHPWTVGEGERYCAHSDGDLAADGWVPIREAPLSLDTLREAWENAEVPTEDAPTREGDVVIVRNDSGLGGYFVRPSHETHDFELEAEGSVRILSRAPRREPWADLADVLRRLDLNVLSDEGASAFAEVLHHDGVRVIKNGEETA